MAVSRCGGDDPALGIHAHVQVLPSLPPDRNPGIASRQRRVIGPGKGQAHPGQDGVEQPFGLTQRQAV
jgi:hypothetical protein